LVVGLVLLVGTVLWSTGVIELPGPFADLRAVSEKDPGGIRGRLALPVAQDRGREFREHLLASIWRERMITITVHVALCDRRSKVENPTLARGHDWASNLYWGAMYGVEGFFKKRPEWGEPKYVESRRSARPVLRRVVFLRRVLPTPAWQQRGVTEPFEICMLAVAWFGPLAADAMRATLMDALGQSAPRIITIGDRTLRFGSASNLVGYVGYNAVKDDPSILPHPDEPLPRPDPRGVFFISPSSAESLGGTLQRLGLHPVLLTADDITPEAYVLYGLTEALAAGQIATGLADKAAERYAQYKKLDLKRARRLFVP
jgi:hypothetical protein